MNYAINRRALVKVAFAGYATPTGVVPFVDSLCAKLSASGPMIRLSARTVERRGIERFSVPRFVVIATIAPRKKCCSYPTATGAGGIKARTNRDGRRPALPRKSGQKGKRAACRMFYTGTVASTRRS
ncbi:hypothetical protein KCP78_02970 [Salmonella enterica subsp. enterica]|nr:hypothetical protein KCP78_02970 [Salmonella enterica subsp. enterica]